MPPPNEDVGCSNTGLRRLQETLPCLSNWWGLATIRYADCVLCGEARDIPSRPISQMKPVSSLATAMIATGAHASGHKLAVSPAKP